MSISIRHSTPNDYPALESIENSADQLLVERLRPDSWDPAPSGLARAEEPGFGLVAASEFVDRGAVLSCSCQRKPVTLFQR